MVFGVLHSLWDPTLIRWLLTRLTWLTFRVLVWWPTLLTVRSGAMLCLLTPIGIFLPNLTMILLLIGGKVGLLAQEQ